MAYQVGKTLSQSFDDYLGYINQKASLQEQNYQNALVQNGKIPNPLAQQMDIVNEIPYKVEYNNNQSSTVDERAVVLLSKIASKEVVQYVIPKLTADELGKFVIDFPPQGKEHKFRCFEGEHNNDMIKSDKFDNEIEPREMESAAPQVLANALLRNGFDLEEDVSVSVFTVRLNKGGLSRFNIDFAQKDLKLDVSDDDVKEQLKRCKEFFTTFHNDDKGAA